MVCGQGIYIAEYFYLEGTVLVSGDLVIAVTVAVQRCKHDAERTGPLTEEDEEVMSKALLRKQEASVVHWGWKQEITYVTE